MRQSHAGPAAVLLISLLLPMAALAQDTPVYKNPQAPIEDRVADLLGRMTVQEKVAQLGGTGMDTPDNERLGIPGFKMADGPHGVRHGKSTCFPTLLALGATWDVGLVERIGGALGREFRGKGRYVALGPCINIIRDPRGGRSFETLGEDPYLIARLATAYIQGMQAEKVIATPKHFACNNQENDRGKTDVQIGERTLREFYLPHFKAAIQEGGAWSIMSAYNRVNDTYCTANRHLQRDILKGEWGFKGFIMSDWGACHTTYAAINGGLDVEMPNPAHFGDGLLRAVESGEVPIALIDDAVARTLRARFWAGVFEEPVEPDESKINTPEHQALCLQAAREAIVLLRNEGDLLPLDPATVERIAVIGPNANVARPTGGGSSHITPYYAVSPLDGIRSRAGEGVEVVFAQGLQMGEELGLSPIKPEMLKPPGDETGAHGLLGEYFTNMTLSGKPAITRIDETIDFDWGQGAPADGVGRDGFSIRWQGTITVDKTGEYWFATTSDDGVRLWVDGRQLINVWADHGAQTDRQQVSLQAGEVYGIRLEYYENSGDAVIKLGWSEPAAQDAGLLEARRAAADADVAIVAVGTSPRIETEGRDRGTLKLPAGQDELIQAVAEANPNTVVLLVNGSAVFMDPWVDTVPAIVQCWFSGQEAGNAIADLLFGLHNPSGRLPVTFPRNDGQMPGFDNQYETIGTARGYRYYDGQQIEPLFAFGHGLSYTRFAYSNLRLTPQRISADQQVTVRVEVANVGDRAGDEVVQLYVRDVQAGIERPVQELKRFRRVSLNPGETQTVEFTLATQDLSYYDVNAKGWVAEPGGFEVRVGGSSRDIATRAVFELI